MPLPTVDELYAEALQDVQGYGTSERDALTQSYQSAMGTAMQELAPGLFGTSAMPSMRLGFMHQYQMALNDLGDRLKKMNLGVRQTFGQGGIGLQQSQQQLDTTRLLGLGNLGVNQGYLGLANSEQAFRQQQADRQYAASLGAMGGQQVPGYDYMDDWANLMGRRAVWGASGTSRFPSGSYGGMWG